MIFLLATLVGAAVAQVLVEAQFNALKSVWASMGCAAPVCPNFASSDPCPAAANATLGCAGGNVVKIDLQNLALSGSLNGGALALLTALTELDINGNRFSSIPTQLGALTALTLLHLNNNTHTGRVPSQLGRLTLLEQLYINSNSQLLGPLPTELARLSRLAELLTYDSPSLGGPFPPLPPAVRRVWAYNCSFTSLPSNFAGLTSITSFQFQDNRLTGDAPVVSLANFVTCKLQEPTNETNCLTCPTATSKCGCAPADAASPTCLAATTTTTAPPTSLDSAAPTTPLPTDAATQPTATTTTFSGVPLGSSTTKGNAVAALALAPLAAFVVATAAAL